jgi:hypothetical protein
VVWQFWGRAAEDVLSLPLKTFFIVHNYQLTARLKRLRRKCFLSRGRSGHLLASKHGVNCG